jgi:four helix bundle protein
MNHKNLDAWNISISMVRKIYKLTEKMPDIEKYGLTMQIRRAAVSIPSNIAEGSARDSDNEFIKFLYYALGSAAELETQLILSSELGFLDVPNDLDEVLQRTKRIIIGMIRYLKSKRNRKK